jgi:hypothetical protein
MKLQAWLEEKQNISKIQAEGMEIWNISEK